MIQAHREFLPERNCMLLRAFFGPLFEERRAYQQQHGLRDIPAEARFLADRCLEALCLWATYQPNGTTLAWSVLLPSVEWRMFLAASSADGSIIARWSPTESEQRRHAPLFECQTQRPGQLLQRSVFEPGDADFSHLLDQFLRRSQQTEGFMNWDEERGEAQLLVALADRDSAWLARMDAQPRDAVLPLEEFGERRPIGPPQPWHYDCGCDPDRLREALLAAVRGVVTELFGNEAEVEVECPRCGREHRLRRP